MSLNIHTARKDHKCHACGKKIPAGHRYWRDYEPENQGDPGKDEKQHTNCELYRHEEDMP